MTIQAIETKYKGYRFRSRLEARWAVFFDALGIEWEYEKEGFTNGEDFYLPDFYLPHHKVWVEVKGDKDALVKEHSRMVSLLDWGSCLPFFDSSSLGSKYGIDGGLLILGNIPDPKCNGIHLHKIVRHYKGLTIDLFTFFKPINSGSYLFTLEYFLKENYSYFEIQKLTNLDICIDAAELYPCAWKAESTLLKNDFYYIGQNQKAFEGVQFITNKAYEKARSARFEHGE
jgi:hypothetical protein